MLIHQMLGWFRKLLAGPPKPVETDEPADGRSEGQACAAPEAGKGESRIVVFLSRVSDEFGHLDEEFRRTLATLPGTSLKTPSDIQGYESGLATLDKLWDHLKHADAVIHLAGEGLGSCAQESMVQEFLDRQPEFKLWVESNKLACQEWTYTQWEVYLAKYFLNRSKNEAPRIFVCQYEKPELQNPLEDESHPSGASGPVSNHLVMLSKLNIHPNIRFHSPPDLIAKLLSTAFGALVHRGSQESLITLNDLLPSLHRSPPAKTLLSWPQLTTTDEKGRWLERAEIQSILETISSQNQSVTLLLGPPGSGKSALLARIAKQCQENDLIIVPIKADSVTENVSTAGEMAQELGLPDGTDVITSVRRLAGEGTVIVLIDQLDALARLAVQNMTRLRLLIEIIDRLSDINRVHVIASCRTFEQKHDPLLRLIDARLIHLELPTWEQVEEVLKLYKLNPEDWNQELKETLRNPQALSIFLALMVQDGDRPIASNYQQMLDQLWNQRVLSDDTGKMSKTAMRVADLLTEQEALWLPVAKFDEIRSEIDMLVARDILRIESGRVGFRHQTLYEHARARSAAQDFGILVNTARSKQELLRVRPQIWHGLNYLREVDQGAYHQALDALWTDNELRKHLRMLLVDFMGMQKAPTAIEAQALLAALENDEWRDRVLISMAGSPGWFARLQDDYLPRLMKVIDPEKQGPLRQIITAAFAFDQESAVDLIRANWIPDKNRAWLAWHALDQVPEWDSGIVDDLVSLVSKVYVADIWIDHVCAAISARLPEEAPRLLRAWLDRGVNRAGECKDDEESAEEGTPARDPFKKRVSDVLRRAKLHTAAEIARAAPEAFVAEVWPWFVRADEAICYISSSGRNIYHFNVLDVDFGDEHERPGEHDLIEALDLGITEWARSDPTGFATFVDQTKDSESLLAHRMLCRGLCQIASLMPEFALEYLLEDTRRFALGQEYSAYTETWALVSRITTSLDQEALERLECAIIDWEPYLFNSEEDEEERELKAAWGRQQKLFLMRQLPEPSHSEAFAEIKQELEREFPDLTPEGRRSTMGSMIGSPVSMEELRAMNDAELLSTVLRFPDSTGGSHPEDFMRGGANQLSPNLKELAKEQAQRIAKLVLSLPPDNFTIAAGYVLRGVVEGGPAQEAIEFSEELLKAGFDGDGFRSDFAFAIEKLISPGSPIPEHIVTVMLGWLESIQEEPSFDPKELEQGESVLWGRSGMRVLPGRGNWPILNALAKNFRLTKPPRWDAWFDLFSSHIERREDPAVWASLDLELQFLSYVNQVHATAFIDRLIERFPALIPSREAARILYSSLRWAKEEDALRWFRVLLEHECPQASQTAGELLALRHLWFSSDADAEILLQSAIEAPSRLTPHQEALHVGLGYTAAEAWRVKEFRSTATDLWTRLLPNGSAKVEKALSRIFRYGNEGDFAKDEYTREILRCIIDNPSILAQQSAEYLIDHLCILLRDEWEPVLIWNVAFALANQVGDTLADIRTAWPLSAAGLTDIVQLLQESPLPAAKSLGVDLMEKLLEFSLPAAIDLVIDLDMRLPVAPRARLSRRRRRLRKPQTDHHANA